MKRKTLFLVVFLCVHLSSYAQIDYNKIVLPDAIKDSISIEEKLVQLAWRNHPDNEIIRKEANIAEHEISLARTTWLNNIRASGNINEFTINPDAAEGRNLFYPRYNFSVTIPLGVISETSNNVKIAKERYKISEERIKSEKLSIRAEVLSRYQDYIMNEKIFQILSAAAENSYAQLVLAKSQFESGEILIEEYSQALSDYNAHQITKIKAERDLLTSKIMLEELIGVEIETVR